MKEKELNVANYIIYNCLKKNCRINTAKLIYLMIYAQGYYLAHHDENLFDDNICAPKIGCLTILGVEEYFKDYIIGFKDKENFKPFMELDEREKEILDNIINNYGKYSLDALIQNDYLYNLLIHYKKSETDYNIIPNYALKTTFKKFLNIEEEEKPKKSFLRRRNK